MSDSLPYKYFDSAQGDVSYKMFYRLTSDGVKLNTDDLFRLAEFVKPMERTRVIIKDKGGTLYIIDEFGKCMVLAEAKDINPSIFNTSKDTPPDPDISTLRKQIKHAKSHLERISLEKKLNEAYKKRKRKKNDSRN